MLNFKAVREGQIWGLGSGTIGYYPNFVLQRNRDVLFRCSRIEARQKKCLG